MNEIIIAMTESDAHVVANKLLQVFLEELGYKTINLGACTPMIDVSETAHLRQPQAIVIGSQNGHALEDLSSLASLKAQHGITCPVLLGGNLSVGAHKADDLEQNFKNAGVDYICKDFEELAVMLEEIVSINDESEVQYA